MRGNSDKQTRSFTTGQTTSPGKRGARDNRPLDNTKKDHSLTKSNRKRQNAGIRHHTKQIPNVGVPYITTLPFINID